MKDINNIPNEFYITYFARTHNGQPIKNGGKIITRRASKAKPNGALGKIFTDKNGTDRFIYWDKEAVSKTGWLGDWRHATGEWTIKAIA
tara:strand:+ start:236 stop:502 length:267 start_codon:yes stop_codon:yes gene_type:complete